MASEALAVFHTKTISVAGDGFVGCTILLEIHHDYFCGDYMICSLAFVTKSWGGVIAVFTLPTVLM